MSLSGTAAVLILAITLFDPTSAISEVQTITASHTYVMGDNDSKNDARRICFLEAKRKVLEKAGTFIESSSKIKNFQLSSDQITSYTAAVLSVETVKEDFNSSNGQNTVTMTVKADVDTADVQKRLAAIVADKGLQEKITAQQQQLKQLEEQMRALSATLGTTSANSSFELRKERNIVLGNIQDLENKKVAAVQVIEDLTEKVKKYIVQGMTMKEVENILGEPRGYRVSERLGLYYKDNSWQYGKLWVNFEGGVVKCVATGPDSVFDCHNR